jgi:hypothetical protein
MVLDEYRQVFKLYVFSIRFARQNCQARVNVNATYVKKAVFKNPNTAVGYMYCIRHIDLLRTKFSIYN